VTTHDDLERWGKASLAFLACFADRFARWESRQPPAKSLRGLVTPVERTNGWQVAEALGDATPDRVQRQNCSTAGKVESGQIGVLLGDPIGTRSDGGPLTDATPRGHGFLDRRRHLPKA
jgi:hypothetical protein